MAGLARWWPLTGLAFVGLFVGCFAVTGDSVDEDSSNAAVLDYYSKSSNQNKEIIGFFMILAACLFFIWFLTMVRQRLARVENGAGTLTALAFGAGIAAAALWVAAASVFTSIAFALDQSKDFTLDPDSYRVVQMAGYALWVSGTTVAAITVTATAVAALRAGLLPKWLAWLSFPVALTMLVSFLWIPFLIFCGWVIAVAVTLMVRSEAPEAAAVPA
jgi:hypothetical protein